MSSRSALILQLALDKETTSIIGNTVDGEPNNSEISKKTANVILDNQKLCSRTLQNEDFNNSFDSDDQPLITLARNTYHQNEDTGSVILDAINDLPNSIKHVENEKEECLFEIPTDHPFELPLHVVTELEIPNITFQSEKSPPQENNFLAMEEQVLILTAAESANNTNQSNNVSDNNTDSYPIEINEENGIITSNNTKRSRKAQRDETKNKRLKGEKYMGYTRSKCGKIEHNKNREERKMKDRCLHGISQKKTNRTLLCGLILESTREKIFHYFWNLPSWSARAAYLKGLVTTKDPERRRKNRSNIQNRKKQSHDIFLPTENGDKILVCRTMLLNTLALGRNTFERWTSKNIHNEEKITHLERNEDTISSAKSTNSARKKQELRKWLQDLPKVPSHYCRSSSKKKYVESVFRSTLHIYKTYQDFCKEGKTSYVSRTLFRKVLKEENIAIHQLRKDQCDLCCSWKTGNISEDIYKTHIQKKNAAEQAKREAKESANNEKLVITMDLQSVLLAPKLEASAIYYKQKLQIHNFTVYSLNDKKVDLYVWHECNGGVTANEFTSCIVHYIQTTQKEYKYKHIVLISDGCGYQNRNKVLASALLRLSQNLGIRIEQLILERGHTMMEADSVHSSLEAYFKPPIYAPSDYITRMRQARDHRPYHVHNLDYTFFLNYENVPNNLKSIKPEKNAKVTDIRGLLYLPTGEYKYKLNHGDEWKEFNKINTRTRPHTSSTTMLTPFQLYSNQLKLSKSKYEHLQALKEVMEKDYHAFYDALPHY